MPFPSLAFYTCLSLNLNGWDYILRSELEKKIINKKNESYSLPWKDHQIANFRRHNKLIEKSLHVNTTKKNFLPDILSNKLLSSESSGTGATSSKISSVTSKVILPVRFNLIASVTNLRLGRSFIDHISPDDPDCIGLETFTNLCLTFKPSYN